MSVLLVPPSAEAELSSCPSLSEQVESHAPSSPCGASLTCRMPNCKALRTACARVLTASLEQMLAA
jgi:hypothetical protein